MSWTKKTLFIIIAISSSFLIGIFFLEIIFGAWIFSDPWFKARSINVIRNQKISYNIEDIYGIKASRSNYSRDKHGLRGSCHNPDEIDILTIGGSTTDQRYLSDGITYQDVLQNYFLERSSKTVCISNAGIDGHSTFGHLASFKNWFPLIDGLKPKYFLFYIGVNDAGFRFQDVEGFDNAGNRNSIKTILREKSAIYDLIKKIRAFHSRHNENAYAVHMVKPYEDHDYSEVEMTQGVNDLILTNTRLFEERLNELIRSTFEWGGIPICVSQPHNMIKVFFGGGDKRGIREAFRYKDIMFNGLDYDSSIRALNAAMERSCTRAGGFYIDLYSKKFDSNDFYDGVHMTPSGAKKVGKFLFEEFIKQKIF